MAEIIDDNFSYISVAHGTFAQALVFVVAQAHEVCPACGVRHTEAVEFRPEQPAEVWNYGVHWQE